MPLSPEAEAFLKLMADVPQPPDMSVAAFREAAARLMKAQADPLPIAKVEDRVIRGGDGQDLIVRIYTPEGPGPFPAVVWMRGGSFTRTTLDQVDPLRRLTAKLTGAVVISVDQRLSPEAHYPQPLEDGEAAAAWAAANARTLNVRDNFIGVGGESSGGNLAASIAVRATERGAPKFAFQFLFGPLTDASLSSPSIEEFGEGYILTKRQLVWAYDQYAPDIARTDPGISPLLAPDLAQMPPAAIITVENDPVRDEGERYAKRLQDAGVFVRHARIDGGVHHFSGPQALPTFFSLCNEVLNHIGAK